MKNFLEGLFARNGAARTEAKFIQVSGLLPNFDLVSGEQITSEFLLRGLADFHVAFQRSKKTRTRIAAQMIST